MGIGNEEKKAEWMDGYLDVVWMGECMDIWVRESTWMDW